MKVQVVNNGHSVNTKGHLVKPGKYTNLAYSALFAATLLSATDSFSKLPVKEQSTPNTEVVVNAPLQDRVTENTSTASVSTNACVYTAEDDNDSTEVNNKGSWFYNVLYKLTEIIGKGASAIYS